MHGGRLEKYDTRFRSFDIFIPPIIDFFKETVEHILIPNTAVFGPTNFIETTTATTTRMKNADEKVSADEKERFLNLDF